MQNLVLIGYGAVNFLLAFIILYKSRHSVLSQFYSFCISCLMVFSIMPLFLIGSPSETTAFIIVSSAVFIFSVFPFFFFHFIVIFLKRHEVLQSRGTIFAIYFTALFSYAASLLGYSPEPMEAGIGLTQSGYIFIITWMSIYFAIGVATAFSFSSAFMQNKPGPRLMLTGMTLLILILPGPFALFILSNVFSESSEWFFSLSMGALILAVFMVFRYKIVGNTPYDTLKSTLAVMNDILFKLNDDFTISMVVGGATQLWGYSNQELMGKSFATLIDRDDYLTEYREFVRRGKMKECYFDAIVHSSNEGDINMNLSITPMFVNEVVVGYVCVARDISDRKTMEDNLRISEERYRSLFNNVPCGIYRSTPSGTLITVNEHLARLLGYGSSAEMEYVNMNRDIYISPKARQLVLERILEDKTAYSHETVVKSKSGGLIPVMDNIHLVYDGQGDLKYVEGMVIDLTERKKLEEEVRQVHKMESLGTLAGGIAHDFNNILQIVMSATYNLKKNHDPVHQTKTIDMISYAIDRGANLVQQILTFAQKKDPTFIPLDVNTVLQKVTNMVSSTFPKTISIVTPLGENIPLIRADQTQFEQVILNLCVNARDAMPDGGTLSVLSATIQGVSIKHVSTEIEPEKEYVHISVSDTGTGMRPETIERIFDPFFTTKERGKGTGLGLAVVYGIVKTHHGFINVLSEVGKGTIFNVYFPVLSGVSEGLAQEQLSAPNSGGKGETILIVEDEKFLVQYLTSLLQDYNYNVLSALDGKKAIEIYRSKQTEINLVISDIGLPTIDGWEVVRRMREINPLVKTIVTSGHLEPLLKSKKQEEGVHGFVQKPYQPLEILDCIRKVLN